MPSREAAPDHTAPHEVTAVLGDLTEAKSLIEDLEKRGIPPAAISLVDPSERREEASANRRIGGTVGRSVLWGVLAGLVVGGILGLAADAWIDLGTSRAWAVGLGGVFGAAIGVAAGGMREVRFVSPAWRESQQTEARGRMAVGVHHVDASVVDSAEQVMAAHHPRRLHRQDR